MQEPAPHIGCGSPYICGYDAGPADISVTYRSPDLRQLTAWLDTFVAPRGEIDVIVGNRRSTQRRVAQKWPKNACNPALRRHTSWYARCYIGQRGSHMSPNLNVDLLRRVRSEFIEMPGLRLRVDQAQRLWNLDRTLCESVLRTLVDAKFLGRFEDDLYARL